jgi:glyoxylase-like metal-dependent hydrolase (beta-lactamase superfamily II)
MDIQKVSQHVYYVMGQPGAPTDHDGFMSNASIVDTKDGILLFDALGTPSLAYLLSKKIQAKFSKPVKKVVLSHYHADHIYGLQVFKEAGAEVIAPIGAKAYLASPNAQSRLAERRESLFPWVSETTYLVKPDKYIERNQHFSFGGLEFEVIRLGSTHSDGDIMVKVLPDNVLLSGDLVFEGRVPFVAGSKPVHWLDKLKQLDAASLKAVVPGHGAASQHPQQAIAFTLGYLQYLHDTMASAVENLTQFDQAYKAADWSQYEKLPAFQANRVNAYYVYLDLERASMESP